MADDVTIEKHICGQCNQEFNSEQAYLDHTCPSSGTTPTDPANLGEDFQAVSDAALQRGEDRKGEDLHPAAEAQAQEQQQ